MRVHAKARYTLDLLGKSLSKTTKGKRVALHSDQQAVVQNPGLFVLKGVDILSRHGRY